MVVENGLGVLRRESEKLAERFFSIYFDQIEKFMQDFRLVFILACVFVSGALFIIIPIVFKVMEANKRVLSLFGAVPQNDIKELSNRCDVFLATYLKNKEEKNDTETNSEVSRVSPGAQAAGKKLKIQIFFTFSNRWNQIITK